MSIPENLLMPMPLHLSGLHLQVQQHQLQQQLQQQQLQQLHQQQQQQQQQQPLHVIAPAHPRAPRKKKTPEEALEAEQLSLTRKRTPKLTINDKVKIIYLHKHEMKSYNEIGAVFRCTKSTISGIIKNANDIIEKASKLTEFQSKQKCRVKQSCSYPEVELSLFQWLNHQSMKSTKVTDKAIRDRAREECKRIYNRDWKPSNGWLTGFKGRMKRKELQLQINPAMMPMSDQSTFFGETELKTQMKWIEKIKERTWAARPDLPMKHLLESTQQVEEASAPAEEQEMIMHTGAGTEHHMHSYENFLQPVYAPLSRMHNMNMDSSSSISNNIHGLPY